MPFQPAFQQVFSEGLTSGRLKKPVSHADSRLLSDVAVKQHHRHRRPRLIFILNP